MATSSSSSPHATQVVGLGSILPQAWFMWLLVSLFYSFQFFLRSSPNAMRPYLLESFNLDIQLFGVLTSAYYWTYAVLQIPVGILLDLKGPRHVLRWGMTLCVAGAMLFASASDFWVAVLGRCLIGAGASVSFIGSVRMNTLWFPPCFLAFSTGLLSSLGKIGGACANGLLPKFIDMAPSWHHVMWGLTLAGVVFTVLFWIFGKNGPHNSFHPQNPHKLGGKALMQGLKTIIKSRLIWQVGIYGYSMYLTLSVFSDGYSIAFLEQALGVKKSVAENMAFFVPMGSCFGAAIISYLSDYYKKRLVFLRLSSLLTLLFSSMIFFGPAMGQGVGMVLLFAFGFFSGGQILIFPIAAQSFPGHLAGIATGVVNSILMASGALHNPLVGSLLKAVSGGATVLTLGHYRMALATLTVMFLLAVWIAFSLGETYPKHLQQETPQEVS